MSGFLETLFRYPDGIVLGNLIASALWVPIAGAGVYFTRHWWMPRWVAFHHKHKMLHLERLKENDG